MARGGGDVPTFLATNAATPREECARLWARGVAAGAGAPAKGDELAVLKGLSRIVTAALGQRRM
jgi:hypothetical protein